MMRLFPMKDITKTMTYAVSLPAFSAVVTLCGGHSKLVIIPTVWLLAL